MFIRFSTAMISIAVIFHLAVLPVAAIAEQESTSFPSGTRYLGQLPQDTKASAPAAEVTEDDWKKLLEAVGKQDWKVAVKLSEQYLPRLKDDDPRTPRLRYIYLFTSAGKYSEGDLSFEDLEKLAKSLTGKEVVLPYREISVNGGGGELNFIHPSKEEKKSLSVSATNQDGTTIHAFEYFKLKDDFDAAANDGKHASISGTIESIAPNPNKSRALVMRVYYSNCTVNLKQ